jgi:hypothetical protein
MIKLHLQARNAGLFGRSGQEFRLPPHLAGQKPPAAAELLGQAPAPDYCGAGLAATSREGRAPPR